jgi:hypothetical protein
MVKRDQEPHIRQGDSIFDTQEETQPDSRLVSAQKMPLSHVRIFPAEHPPLLATSHPFRTTRQLSVFLHWLRKSVPECSPFLLTVLAYQIFRDRPALGQTTLLLSSHHHSKNTLPQDQKHQMNPTSHLSVSGMFLF